MNKIIDVISLFAPFILISIFVFMSIFNQDLKAMFLLAGIFFMLYILHNKFLLQRINFRCNMRRFDIC